MRLSIHPATLSVVVLLLLAGDVVSQIVDNDNPSASKRKRSLVSTWHSLSFSMSLEDGKHKTLTDEDGAVSLIITDKTFTLRLGTKVLTDMTYVADSRKTPCTIDLKSNAGEMIGIYQLKDDRLTISLNDKAKGRPKDFDEQSSGMVIALRRVYPVGLYSIDADGKNLRRVLLLRDFTFVGSAEWSPDGRRIAMDSWRPTMGETCSDARIFMVNADGSSFKDLGPGAMPSWSPDGKRLVCSQYGRQNADGRQRGIWIMNADGAEAKLVDASGWGAQWSPKNNEIAYYVFNNNNAVFKIYDVDKATYRILDADKTYSQISWGFTWSADGKWIAFKGNLNGECEIAAVSNEEGKKDSTVLLQSMVQPETENADSTIAWAGVGMPLLISTQTKTDSVGRLYLVESADGSKPPKLFPGIPAHWSAFGPAWSSDGKKLIFSAVTSAKAAQKEQEADDDPFS